MKAALLVLFAYGLGLMSGAVLRTYQVLHHFPGGYQERRIAHLSRELNLDPQQEVALRDVFRAADERAQQINEEVAWDLEDIHQDSVQAIDKILTPQQAAHFHNLHKRQHGRHHHSTENLAGTEKPVIVATATVGSS